MKDDYPKSVRDIVNLIAATDKTKESGKCIFGNPTLRIIRGAEALVAIFAAISFSNAI